MNKPYIFYLKDSLSVNLEKFGKLCDNFTFLIANNVNEAVVIIKNHKIKVVVCDEALFTTLLSILQTDTFKTMVKPSFIIVSENNHADTGKYHSGHLFIWVLPNNWQLVILEQVINMAFKFYDLHVERNLLKNNIEEWENKELNILKRNILRNLSHEIRTPLSGVLGFSNLLISDLTPNARQKEYFSIIEESSERLINYLDNLAELLEFETCDSKIEYSEFSVTDLLNALIEEYKPIASRKKIVISFDKRAISYNDVIITSDKSKVYSILSKLLNSSLFHLSKGSVEFNVKHLKSSDFLYILYKEKGFVYETNTLLKLLQFPETNKPRSLESTSIEYLIFTRYIKQIHGKIWVKKIRNDELLLIGKFPRQINTETKDFCSN